MNSKTIPSTKSSLTPDNSIFSSYLSSSFPSTSPFSLQYIPDTISNITLLRTPPLYILPLGDSITQGSRIPGGYRRKLYNLLFKHRYNLHYLGTKSTNCWWKTLVSQRCTDAQKK